jgi:DNA mismatch repair protein MutS
VVKGSADKSYGIEVARLAGLPSSVLDRARAINNQLVTNRTKRLGLNKKQNQTLKNNLTEDGELDIERLPLFESIN